MTPQERARRLLDVGDHIVVATADARGTPWISPLFYAADDDYDLYWTSDREARHSVNIRATGRAALVVYEIDPDRPVDGVYMQAEVRELTDPTEIRHGIEVMLSRPQPDKWVIQSPADVSGDGPWRIYRAHPVSIEVRASGERAGKAIALRRDAEFRDPR